MDSQFKIMASFQAAIADLGFEARTHEQINGIIGLGLAEGVATLFPQRSPSELVKLATLFDYYYYYHRKNTEIPALFPGVTELLQQLHALGYWLAVATGKSRQGLNQALLNTGLKDLFLSTRCAEESISKPHPQMLLEIMAELEKSPLETLMIGDSVYDLQMANNAQVASVAVSYGVHSETELSTCQPLACFDDLTKLPAFLATF